MIDTPPEGPAKPGPSGGSDFLGAARGQCPRCGAASMFDGFVQFAPRCANCGLDYSAFNVGDGPAAFLTLIIGTIIVVLAVWLELAVEPPLWVHVVLWLPLTTLLVFGGLRIAKGWLLAAEYRRGAREHGGRDPGAKSMDADKVDDFR